MAGDLPPKKSVWTLNQDAFDKFLYCLDADRERASEEYEQFRQRLVKIFQWRGCSNPEEYADRALDRVARRVADGQTPEIRDPWLYIHAVALNVLRERWRDPRQREVPLEESRRVESPAIDPGEVADAESARVARERQLSCLEDCMDRLPVETQNLVVRYHEGKGGTKIRTRKKLAEELGIPLNALRIRLYRIRGSLQQCVRACVEGESPEIDPHVGHSLSGSY